MHEQSETVQDADGKWINVYGRDTPQAGQQLPDSGRYDTVHEAVSEAVSRSFMHGLTHPDRGSAMRKFTARPKGVMK